MKLKTTDAKSPQHRCNSLRLRPLSPMRSKLCWGCLKPQSPHPSPGVQPARSAFWGHPSGNTADLIAQQDGPPDAVTSWRATTCQSRDDRIWTCDLLTPSQGQSPASWQYSS